MLKKLTLRNFKSFENAVIEFGPITTLIGSNASGKSNLLDALKFLQAIARGYTLAEALGGKTAFGGRVWDGIRGGLNAVARFGQSHFSIHLEYDFQDLPGAYAIEVAITAKGPFVVLESLYHGEEMLFESRPAGESSKILYVDLAPGGDYRKAHVQPFPSHQPLLSQVGEISEIRSDPNAQFVITAVNETRRLFGAMRFLDFDPKQMRLPAIPGEKTISENGENLSSVLRTINEEHPLADALASRVRSLTPMDVHGLDFDEFPDGRTLAVLVEGDARRTSLASASDGTLRFLGILSALFSPEPPSLVCFEELETGLHPARLYLLMNLLEKQSSSGRLQILSTTHSPQILRLLREQGLAHAYLTYRVEGSPETRIKSLREIPHLMEVLKSNDIARLYEGGWMEQTMFYEEGESAPFEIEPFTADKVAEEPAP